MSNYHKANQYKQTSVLTASRGQLLIMLYEAAIRNTKLAIQGIEKKDIVTKGKYIGKTHDILNELVNTLDFNIGGEIAKDLERLYNFMIDRLIKGNLENNVEHLKEVQKLLETLLDAWKVAVTQTQTSNSNLNSKG